MAGRCLKSVKSCDRWLIAAVALGIGRNTITRKIQELGLDGGKGGESMV
ncbi:MAG: hypothetical protein ACOYM3_32020 [Terrimicrobiaceae bacterium]